MPLDLASAFLMSDAHSKRAFHMRPIGRFDAYPILRGQAKPNTPPAFEVAGGDRVVDLVGTGYAGVYLISPAFRDLLTANAFTGWDTVEAILEGDTSNVLTGFRLLTVTGRAGPIEDSRSQRAILRAPSDGSSQSGWRGLLFDPETWDGSDLFLPLNTAHIIARANVREAIMATRLSNVAFERITEVERLWDLS